MMLWNFARDTGLTILSKDGDFRHLSLVRGMPPKAVWLRFGNCSTRLITELLGRDIDRLQQFEASESETVLVLDR